MILRQVNEMGLILTGPSGTIVLTRTPLRDCLHLFVSQYPIIMLLLRVQATCGNKDGDGAGTSAVSDTECGTGYVYDATKSAAACTGATCDASGADRETCCAAQATCGAGKSSLSWTPWQTGMTCGNNGCPACTYPDNWSDGTFCNGAADCLNRGQAWCNTQKDCKGIMWSSYWKNNHIQVCKDHIQSSNCQWQRSLKTDSRSSITNTDCGANYVYDPSKSASPCAGTTCDASGADKATCCVAQVRGCKRGVR